MLTWIIVVVIVLVVAILIIAQRVNVLVNVIKKKDDIISKNNHLQGVFLTLFGFIGIVVFLYYSFDQFDTYNLPIASEHGVITEKLFWITMGITVVVFILTQIFLFGFSLKYSYKKTNKAYYYPHNGKLELVWTIIPAIVLAFLIISGLKQWNQITGPAPENAEVIEVLGFQFAWAFRYPGKDKQLGKASFREIDAVNAVGIDLKDQRSFDDFIPTQLVLPKGVPVLLKIRSRDVIHSVYNPHFRMQMNAVPGHPTRFWFTPSKSTQEMRELTGNDEFQYELVCNKICGKSHYAMKGIITVLEQDEYKKWYEKQQENTWLKQNPNYLSKVPKRLREKAKIASGIENEIKTKSATSSLISNLN